MNGGSDVVLTAGELQVRIRDGAVRRILFGGVEVVRQIDYPIRDFNWATLATVTISQAMEADAYHREFHTQDGKMSGTFSVLLEPRADGGRLVVDLELKARSECLVNRAGFIVLHPLSGVVGQPLRVTHPDGGVEPLHFPHRISPAQPVRDITALRHRIGPAEVDIAFSGEVFEMEDQRNWTDASYKTYCRPLALPWPYAIAEGETLRQSIVVSLSRAGEPDSPSSPSRSRVQRATMPETVLAHEAATCGAPDPALARLDAQGLLLRVDAEHPVPAGDLPPWPVTLEVVTGSQPEPDLERVRNGLEAAGIRPIRVVALPRAYLDSHQPDGPWPASVTPTDLLDVARRVFPRAEVGGGMLTNFTEFNRCPPDRTRIGFATFGTTAIVHAADDASVVETLETVPQIIDSARAIVGGRPLRLGLMSIGMRSNPYGDGVVANPGRTRLPMVMDDPRQSTEFAAAFAVALAGACACGGVAAFAPAMTGGPIGMRARGQYWPIWHVVAAMSALAGTEVSIEESGAQRGAIVIRGQGRRGVTGLAANFAPHPLELDVAGYLPLGDDEAAADPGWIDSAARRGPALLVPLSAVVLKEPQ